MISKAEQGISPVFDTTGRLIEIITYKRGFVNTREILNRFDAQGRKHGYWKEFYDNFELKSEIYYKHGLRNGYYKAYDEKGNLTVIKKYVNDVEEIIARETTPLQMQHEYYPNGRVKREASFRGGKREGTWREFDENGNVINSQIYQNGWNSIPTVPSVHKGSLSMASALENGSSIFLVIIWNRWVVTRMASWMALGPGTTSRARSKNRRISSTTFRKENTSNTMSMERSSPKGLTLMA